MPNIEQCPTCGMAVRVVSGNEGTSHYAPAPPYPHRLLSGGRWYVPADDHRGAVAAGDALAEAVRVHGHRDDAERGECTLCDALAAYRNEGSSV